MFLYAYKKSKGKYLNCRNYYLQRHFLKKNKKQNTFTTLVPNKSTYRQACAIIVKKALISED